MIRRAEEEDRKRSFYQQQWMLATAQQMGTGNKDSTHRVIKANTSSPVASIGQYFFSTTSRLSLQEKENFIHNDKMRKWHSLMLTQ